MLLHRFCNLIWRSVYTSLGSLIIKIGLLYKIWLNFILGRRYCFYLTFLLVIFVISKIDQSLILLVSILDFIGKNIQLLMTRCTSVPNLTLHIHISSILLLILIWISYLVLLYYIILASSLEVSHRAAWLTRYTTSWTLSSDSSILVVSLFTLL